MTNTSIVARRSAWYKGEGDRADLLMVMEKVKEEEEVAFQIADLGKSNQQHPKSKQWWWWVVGPYTQKKIRPAG